MIDTNDSKPTLIERALKTEVVSVLLMVYCFFRKMSLQEDNKKINNTLSEIQEQNQKQIDELTEKDFLIQRYPVFSIFYFLYPFQIYLKSSIVFLLD